MNTFIQDVVAEAVRKQPWYARNANTIVAGLVALASVLSFVATLELDLPPAVAAGVPVAVTAIGTIVTKLTRNGVQMSTATRLEHTQAARTPVITDSGMSILTAELERVRSHAADDYVGQHRAE